MQINKHGGFTLIELLLYIILAVIVLTAVSALFFLLLQTQAKNQTIAEVEQQGMQIMQIITQKIRNAAIINTPIQGTSSISLSIEAAPIIFDESNGILRITENGITTPLTSSRLIVSNLNFYNLSLTATPGIIRISFTLTRANPEGKNEFEYSKTFYGSASLRNL